MPKMKTNKGAMKRFRVTRNGKVLYAKSGRRHLMSSKSAKKRRHMRRPGFLHGPNIAIIRRLHVNQAGRGEPRGTGAPDEGKPPASV